MNAHVSACMIYNENGGDSCDFTLRISAPYVSYLKVSQ